MTFREKLKQEHPEDVKDRYVGGCSCCPYDCGYEGHNDGLCKGNWVGGEGVCRACLDRETPLTPEEQEKHDLKINAEIIKAYCDMYECNDCPARRNCDSGLGKYWGKPDYCGEKQRKMLDAFEAALPPLDDDVERLYTASRNLDMPDNLTRHALVCTELLDLYKRKNQDYGDSFHKSYEEWGLTMAAIRICDKYNRFAQLVHKGGDSLVKDESIRDTLIDLANYAIMTVMELDEERNDKNGNEA